MKTSTKILLGLGAVGAGYFMLQQGGGSSVKQTLNKAAASAPAITGKDIGSSAKEPLTRGVVAAPIIKGDEGVGGMQAISKGGMAQVRMSMDGGPKKAFDNVPDKTKSAGGNANY